MIKYLKLILLLLILANCRPDNPVQLPEVVIQEFILSDEVNLWSTYINTTDSLLLLFEDILDNVIYIKVDTTMIYNPTTGINNIGNHQIGKSYYICLSIEDTFSIAGPKVNINDQPIVLFEEWNSLGYLLDQELDVLIALDPIMQNVIFMKDGNGDSFWPDMDLNIIGNMIPGKGYRIKMSTRCLFYYPEIESN